MILLGLLIFFGGLIAYSMHRERLKEIKMKEEDLRQRNLANVRYVKPLNGKLTTVGLTDGAIENNATMDSYNRFITRCRIITIW